MTFESAWGLGGVRTSRPITANASVRALGGFVMIPATAFLSFVPDNYLAAIGQVVTQWSRMEAMLDACIWQAARLRNDLGRSVTSQMQVMGKLDLLATILWQTNTNLAPQFDPIAAYVRECLQGKRNMVAHGMWITLPNEPTFPAASVVKFSAKGRLTSQGAIMPLTDLNELALQIAEVSSWLMEFCDLLPKLKQRRGGLGHKTPAPQNPLGCATRRKLVLQPPVRRPKAPAKPRKPLPPAKHRQSRS